MSKKRLNTEGIANELAGASVFFQQRDPSATPVNEGIAPQEDLAQKDEQVSSPMSEPLSTPDTPRLTPDVEDTSYGLSTEDIETMTFELRKEHRTKVNTEIVDEWKEELNRLTFQLRVGKYELLEYIIGVFLGKVKQKK